MGKKFRESGKNFWRARKKICEILLGEKIFLRGREKNFRKFSVLASEPVRFGPSLVNQPMVPSAPEKNGNSRNRKSEKNFRTARKILEIFFQIRGKSEKFAKMQKMQKMQKVQNGIF